MINVLEICNSFGIGGTERTMQNFVKYLNKQKFCVFSCAFFNGGIREPFIKEFSKGTLIANGNTEILKEFIMNNQIEIIHRHGIPGRKTKEFDQIIKFLSFCKKKGIKIIETSPFSSHEKQIENLLDAKLFVSKTSLLKFLYKFNKPQNTKYGFLYNPIDIELYESLIKKKDKNIIRKKLKINPNEFVIGKVGRADITKWDNTIIDIMPTLIKKIPNLKVIIRSIPPQKIKEIENKKLKQYFIFLPETVVEEEIIETYLAMDIMIHTSRIGESFGIALVEGMICGIPIISTPTDWMRKRIYERDNSQQEIMGPQNKQYIINGIKEIGNQIEILLKDPQIYEKIKQENKKWTKTFDAKILTKQLEDIFETGEIKTINYDLEIKQYKRERKQKLNIIKGVKDNILFTKQIIIFKYLSN